MTNIALTVPSDQQSSKIVQLYEHLELYSAGEPAAHTLFVLGRAPLSGLPGLGTPPDQLLLVDPPADAPQRFRLPANVAAILTHPQPLVGVAQVETQPGGVAHIRIGQHFLDIYSQLDHTVVALPALGIVCGGTFGSEVIVPKLANASDGSEELNTLRLLVRLVKQPNWQLYIPQTGSLGRNSEEVITRLANDVAYLHSLRRVVPGLPRQTESLEYVEELSEELLPATRRSAVARRIHQANVQILSRTLPQTSSK